MSNEDELKQPILEAKLELLKAIKMSVSAFTQKEHTMPAEFALRYAQAIALLEDTITFEEIEDCTCN